MKYKKIILLLLIALIYFGNYHICQYFYPGSEQDQIDNWYNLKRVNYNIVIALSLYVTTLKPINIKVIDNIEFLITSIIISIVTSNIIDRLFFNSRFYEWNDIFVVVVIILISIFEYRRKWQKEKQ